MLVTHALDTVRQICDRAVMLDHGELYAKGDAGRRRARAPIRAAAQRPELRPRGGLARGRARRGRADPRGRLHRTARSRRGGLTIQIDARANQPSTTSWPRSRSTTAPNYARVVDGREAGIDLGRIDGKKRVRFRRAGRCRSCPAATASRSGLEAGESRRAPTTCRPSATGSRSSTRSGRRRGGSSASTPQRRTCERQPVPSPIARVPTPLHPRERGTRLMLIGSDPRVGDAGRRGAAHVETRHEPGDAGHRRAHVRLRHIAAGSSPPSCGCGLSLFGLSAVVWLVVLSRASLSFAYPFAALTYV